MSFFAQPVVGTPLGAAFLGERITAGFLLGEHITADFLVGGTVMAAGVYFVSTGRARS